MGLIYHHGQNFGDALNPLIISKIIAKPIIDDKYSQIVGIGSILGLKRPKPNTKFIIFSSGYAKGHSNIYGHLPNKKERADYDFRCVRGPMTAEILELPKEKAVADGAILLPRILSLNQKKEKKFRYSYIPHVSSVNFYSDWEDLLAQLGINLISPKDSVENVINQIIQSEFIIAEAMHGAIVADALGIPWIKVKTTNVINNFKWLDWELSLNLSPQLYELPGLFDQDYLAKFIKAKSISPIPVVNKIGSRLAFEYQERVKKHSFLSHLEKLKNAQYNLSNRRVLNEKQDRLMEIAHQINLVYGR